jgi:hypothetical protein
LAAHIHNTQNPQANPLPLVISSGGVEISLVPPAQVTNNAFMWNNVTNSIDFICQDNAYVNVHCQDTNFNVRANLVGMEALCNLGTALLNDKTVQSWGPAAAVGEMQSWVVKVNDLFKDGNPGSAEDCTNVRITYKVGTVYLTGHCSISENIVLVSYVFINDNNTRFDVFDSTIPGLQAFPGKAPFSFQLPADHTVRDYICGSQVGAATQGRIEIKTDMGNLYWGNVEISGCPAITQPPPAVPTSAHTLSYTVFLTVLLALFTKWLF